MLVILISFAFGFGLVLSRIGLPPMVGFLVAGFAYNMAGLVPPNGLNIAADLGITLLLFSIGLKLDVKGLFKAEIWASTTIQMIVTTIFMCGVLFLGQTLFNADFMEMSWQTIVLLGFALSFSSTVFAVKVLEDKGDLSAFYGKVAIGILIMQDMFAVLFLSISAGKIPSIWALVVLGLPFVRPLLFRLLDMSGRGELFLLCGLFLALGVGAEGFALVGLKADLGALFLGILVAGHPRASELSKALFGFKELMLVGFFVSVGMTGLPTMEMMAAALLLCLFIPVKTGIYHMVVSWFGLRARSSLFAALTLSNYSEFGLIVSAIAVNQGLLSSQWLIIMAITVSLSFVVASPLSVQSESVYRKMFAWLVRFERDVCHPNDAPIDPGDVRAIVFGMGRIGAGAYDTLKERWGTDICGVEHAPDRVDFNRSQGRNVVLGDACDTEFWLKLKKDINLELVVLAMPNHHGNVYAARQIRNMGIKCQVVAIARFPEEVDELSQIGVCAAFNMYQQAGAGLIQAAMETLDDAGRIKT